MDWRKYTETEAEDRSKLLTTALKRQRYYCTSRGLRNVSFLYNHRASAQQQAPPTWSSIFDLVPLVRTNDRSGTTTFPSAQTGVPLHAHLIEKLYQRAAAEQSVAARVCLRTRLRERRLSVWESSTSRHTQDAETRVRSGLLYVQEVPPVVKLLPGTASDSHVRAKRSAS
jgi:hypothetical protein